MTQIHRKSPAFADLVVGENVRRLRTQAGLSQEQLGKHLGVTFQQVQKYEKGTNRISAGKLAIISKVFNVGYATLFVGTDGQSEDVGNERLVFSGEAFELARMFDRIPSKRTRNAILDIARSLGSRETT